MNSALKYIGKITENINIRKYIDNSIDTYVEPFAGSFNCGFNIMEKGYFGKTVLNDKDYYIANFWKCVKENPDKLIEEIKNIYSQLKYESLFRIVFLNSKHTD